MNILVISSPDLTRQRNVQMQFANQSLQVDYECMPAIMMNPGRYGISKSHKKCVELAKKREWPFVVILEDDIDFLSTDSLKIFFDLIPKLPTDCDLFLGSIHAGELEDQMTEQGFTKAVGRINGFHMYWIPSKYYDKFLEADEQYNIDFYISKEMKANIYVAVPFLALEIPGYSYNAKEHKEYSKFLCQKYRCI